MNKKIIVLIMCLMTLVMTSATLSAQQGSLAVWENIADGVLTSTWKEVTDDEWIGQNESGLCDYNCSTNNNATAYNNTIQGDRWYQIAEVQSTDAEAGVGFTQTISITDFYAVVYYLDGTDHGTGAEAYIIYSDDNITYYWNGSGWNSNVTKAIDYSKNVEVDYYNCYVRMKALWNWNELADGVCTVRFKVWSGAENKSWMIDDNITRYAGDSGTTAFYPGLYVNSIYDIDASYNWFRRIMFWNLSWDMDGAVPKIVCPTYDAMQFYDDMIDYDGLLDIWNQTQALKNFINTWDLTSYYSEQIYGTGAWGTTGNQNDTTYVFTNMITDTQEFIKYLYPDFPWIEEIPDNILTFMIYQTPDASHNEDSDYMLIRIDADNDHIYESTDYAIWCNASGTDTFYQGTTVIDDFLLWMGDVGKVDISSGDDDFGNIFRDAPSPGYYAWHAYLNWDAYYKSDTARIGDSICGMSISFYDANTSVMSVLQDFNESNDDVNKTATDNISWAGIGAITNSALWLHFNVDESLTGVPMEDPNDPLYFEELTTNLLQSILPMLIAILLVIFIVGTAFTVGVTKESLITLLILIILAVVVITIITGLTFY